MMKLQQRATVFEHFLDVKELFSSRRETFHLEQADYVHNYFYWLDRHNGTSLNISTIWKDR